MHSLTKETSIIGLKKATAIICWILAIALGAWTLSWFEPNWIRINNYLNIKVPAAAVGIFFIFTAASIFNAVTMGRNYGGIKTNPIASAIFFGALFIALALVISWA